MERPSPLDSNLGPLKSTPGGTLVGEDLNFEAYERPNDLGPSSKSLSRKRQVKLNLDLSMSSHHTAGDRSAFQKNGPTKYSEPTGIIKIREPPANDAIKGVNPPISHSLNVDPVGVHPVNQLGSINRPVGQSDSTQLLGSLNARTYPHEFNLIGPSGTGGGAANTKQTNVTGLNPLFYPTNPLNSMNLVGPANPFGLTTQGFYPLPFNYIDPTTGSAGLIHPNNLSLNQAVPQNMANPIGLNGNSTTPIYNVLNPGMEGCGVLTMYNQPNLPFAPPEGGTHLGPSMPLPSSINNRPSVTALPPSSGHPSVWGIPTRHGDTTTTTSENHPQVPKADTNGPGPMQAPNRENKVETCDSGTTDRHPNSWPSTSHKLPLVPGNCINPASIPHEKRNFQENFVDGSYKLRGYVYKLKPLRKSKKVPVFYFDTQMPNNSRMVFANVPYMLLNPVVFRKFVAEWHVRPNVDASIESFLISNGISNPEIFENSLGINVAPLEKDLGVSTVYTPLNTIDSMSPLFKSGNGTFRCPYPDCHAFDGQFENLCAFASHLNACHPKGVNCPVCHDYFTRKDSAKRHIARKHTELEHSDTKLGISRKLRYLIDRGLAAPPKGWENRLRGKYIGALEFWSRKKQADAARVYKSRQSPESKREAVKRPWVSFKRQEEEISYELNLSRILSGPRCSFREYNTSDAFFM